MADPMPGERPKLCNLSLVGPKTVSAVHAPCHSWHTLCMHCLVACVDCCVMSTGMFGIGHHISTILHAACHSSHPLCMHCIVAVVHVLVAV